MEFIFKKTKNNKRLARTSSKKVKISNKAKGLTSQAGLIPVVKFLQRTGMSKTIVETIDHKRGDNALYDSVDAVFLTVMGIIGDFRLLSFNAKLFRSKSGKLQLNNCPLVFSCI